MKSIAAFAKLSAVVLVTFGCYAFFIIGCGVLKLLGVSHGKWRNICLMSWGKLASASLSIKVATKGPVPEPPFFLVSNHLSYVDIIVLFSRLKTTFVSKKEVAEWPVIGFIAKSIGIVFIDRTNRKDLKRVNQEISNAVSAHMGLTLFPEGTTSPGKDILRFRPSLLKYPAQSELGAHYCTLHYETGHTQEKDDAYISVCWWDDSELGSHLWNLAKKTNIHATISFGDKAIHENDRKILSEKLHKEASGIFSPVCKKTDLEFEPIQL